MEFGYSLPVNSNSLTPFKRNKYLAEMGAVLDVVSDAFDSIWVSDHLMFENSYVLESWTMSTWIAACYPNVKVGQAVMCNSFRSPSLVAKMAATLQEISKGRLILGYGAGWHKPEYDAYGFNYDIPKVRIAMLKEAVEIIRAMWTEPQVTFHGNYYDVNEAFCEPKPDPVPILMIGGKGEKLTMRVAARFGDWWNISSPDLETAAYKLRVLQGHCNDLGRDYGSIRKTFTSRCVIDRSNTRAKEIVARSDAIESPLFVGDSFAIRDQIECYEDLGYDYCMLSVSDFGDIERLKIFVEEVVPYFV